MKLELEFFTSSSISVYFIDMYYVATREARNVTAHHIYVCIQTITSVSILLQAKGTKICGSNFQDAQNTGHSNTYISTKNELQNLIKGVPIYKDLMVTRLCLKIGFLISI